MTNQNPAIAAAIFVLTLAFVSPAFAQVAAVAEPTFADQAWGWFATVAIAAVPIITGFGAKLLWSQSRLAGIILSQKLLDKLNAGIIAIIRAEVERRRQAGKTAPVPLTTGAKEAVVEAVQLKVEAAFKETLAHFEKKPGSEAVRDMIFGRMSEALAKPPEVPHVLSK